MKKPMKKLEIKKVTLRDFDVRGLQQRTNAPTNPVNCSMPHFCTVCSAAAANGQN
jgi:hypothetical protein